MDKETEKEIEIYSYTRLGELALAFASLERSIDFLVRVFIDYDSNSKYNYEDERTLKENIDVLVHYGRGDYLLSSSLTSVIEKLTEFTPIRNLFVKAFWSEPYLDSLGENSELQINVIRDKLPGEKGDEIFSQYITAQQPPKSIIQHADHTTVTLSIEYLFQVLGKIKGLDQEIEHIRSAKEQIENL